MILFYLHIENDYSIANSSQYSPRTELENKMLINIGQFKIYLVRDFRVELKNPYVQLVPLALRLY